MTMLRSTTAWQALAAHHEAIKDATLRELFAGDATRGESLTAEGAGLFLDYSKNRITAETLQLLVLHEKRGFAPGVREKLTLALGAVARSLRAAA
jgi:glucose-6-phosphate isomerase